MLLATTKLEAVNILLSAIGADPVDSLDTEIDVDVANAVRMLDTTSRNVQRKGWDFNRGTYTFTPDANTHRIRWNNTIISYQFYGGLYAIRDGYLYDMTGQTFEFPGPVSCTVTVALDFDELPDCFRNYIALKAALDFQMQYLADGNVSAVLQSQVAEAQSDLVDYDLHMGDYNMLQLTNIAHVLERK